jgi:hypothetical protein
MMKIKGLYLHLVILASLVMLVTACGNPDAHQKLHTSIRQPNFIKKLKVPLASSTGGTGFYGTTHVQGCSMVSCSVDAIVGQDQQVLVRIPTNECSTFLCTE